MCSPKDLPESSSQEQLSLDKTFVEGELINPLGFYSSFDSRSLSISQSDIIGTGKIIGLLGSGGMARVYKIYNEKLEVYRAVKILNCVSDNLIQRFQTESKITAKLNHPCIVKIFDVGNWCGLPYIEMEYIDGITLQSFITKNGKLPDIVSSSIAIQIANALDYLHNEELILNNNNFNGIIHRDLKPSNIMISLRGEVRLLDFGIALPIKTNVQSATDSFTGTLQYLSPEQIEGKNVDCRSDIYSLGTILYEMLTGTKTFQADSLPILLENKFTNNFKHLSEFDYHIPSSLIKIVHRCLQPDKYNRYCSASDLLKDLTASHRSVTNIPASEIIKFYLSDSRGLSCHMSSCTPKRVFPIAASIFLFAVFIIVTIFYSNLNKIFPEKSNNDYKPSVIVNRLQQLDSAKPEKIALLSTVNSTSGLKCTDTLSSRASKHRPITYRNYDDINLKSAKKYYKKKSFSEVIRFLEKISDSNPEYKQIKIMLFEAYLETGRLSDAEKITQLELNDAQFDFLCGKFACQTGDPLLGLEHYKNCLTKPSTIRDFSEIRKDALFCIAETWNMLHNQKPSKENRLQMLNAWKVSKKAYADDTLHQRYIISKNSLEMIKN